MKRLTLTLALMLPFCTAAADLPVESRELQFYWVEESYRIGIDNDPAWTWQTFADPQAPAFQAVTPSHYYPPGVVTVRLHKGAHFTGSDAGFESVAAVAFIHARKNFNSIDVNTVTDPQWVQFEELNGWSVDFVSVEAGAAQANRIIVARNHAGQIMTLTASTLPEKLGHLAPALQRIWDNISFAPPAQSTP